MVLHSIERVPLTYSVDSQGTLESPLRWGGGEAMNLSQDPELKGFDFLMQQFWGGWWSSPAEGDLVYSICSTVPQSSATIRLATHGLPMETVM